MLINIRFVNILLDLFDIGHSPDDTSNQLTLRFSKQRKSDEGPEDVDTVDVPLLIDRQKYLAMNPLAAAKMFQTLVEHVFEKLFGLRLAHKTKSTGLPPGKRPQGALGSQFDMFCIFETQGKYFNIVSDTVLSSSLLQNRKIITHYLFNTPIYRSRVFAFPRHHLGRHSLPDILHHRTRRATIKNRRSSYRPDRVRPSAETLPRRGRPDGRRSPSRSHGWTIQSRR
jgi:hypothetical protein